MPPSTASPDAQPSAPFALIQRDVLEWIATGAPREIVLGRIASGVESLLDDGLVSIQVVDGEVLRHVASPSLPPSYVAAVDGLPITAQAQAAGVRPGLASGTGAPCICLAVSDTGSGIADDMQPRIFDPFYTTKPMGHGSGLGLSTVMSLVRNHGGQISVDSTLGRGSTFRVTLPIAHGGAASRRPDEPLPSGDGRGALVLLVDDEPSILTVVKVGLERVGYRVITAASARAALKLLHEHGTQVVFALLDVMMPDMDGVELARVVRKRFPRVALAAATGLPSDLVLQRLRDVGIERCLTKPYELRHVLDVLQAHVPPLPPSKLSGA